MPKNIENLKNLSDKEISDYALVTENEKNLKEILNYTENPLVLKSILKNTYVKNESILTKAIDKLNKTGNADIRDYAFFLNNPYISANTFELYLADITEKENSNQIFAYINQADYRVNKNILDKIIKDGKNIKSEILLNPNLNENTRNSLIEKNLNKITFIRPVFYVKIISPENKELFGKIISQAKTQNFLYNFLKTYRDVLTSEHIKQIIDNKDFFDSSDKIKAFKSFLYSYPINKNAGRAIMKFINEKENLGIRQKIRIINNNPYLLNDLGYKNTDELIRDYMTEFPDELISFPVKISENMQKELLKEIKDFDLSKYTDKNEIYQKKDEFVAKTAYLAKTANPEFLPDIIETNSKNFSVIDEYVLKREDFTLTEKIIDYFLKDFDKGKIEKLDNINGAEIYHPYFNYDVLEKLFKKINNSNENIQNYTFKYLKERNFFNIFEKTAESFEKEKISMAYLLYFKYIAQIKNDKSIINYVLNKIDRLNTKEDIKNSLKYDFLNQALSVNKNLTADTINSIINNQYFKNDKYCTLTAYNKELNLIEQKNAPEETVRKALKNRPHLLRFVKRKIDENILLNDIIRNLTAEGHTDTLLGCLENHPPFIKGKYGDKIYKETLKLTARKPEIYENFLEIPSFQKIFDKNIKKSNKRKIKA